MPRSGSDAPLVSRGCGEGRLSQAILLKKSLLRGLATKLGNNDSNAASVLNHYCVN